MSQWVYPAGTTADTEFDTRVLPRPSAEDRRAALQARVGRVQSRFEVPGCTAVVFVVR